MALMAKEVDNEEGQEVGWTIGEVTLTTKEEMMVSAPTGRSGDDPIATSY